MSIVTRCPSCDTTFRVTPPQLQAQRGMVRCGQCARVFDGFKTLATLPDSVPSEPSPRETVIQTAPIAEPETPLPQEVVSQSTTDVVAPPPELETPAAPQALETPVVPLEPEAPTMASTPAPEFKPPPAPVQPPVSEIAAQRRRRGGWGLGVSLMLVGLAAQGVYFYRSEIAAFAPEARPHLATMCGLLRCAVALPQRPRQITIEASDLQATDPANPGLIVLTATLRNRAATELGFPALDVVLTNIKDHTVARRIFLPADYLAPGKDVRRGIAPNAEVTIRLDLETGDLGAVGFRLDLTAAPVL